MIALPRFPDPPRKNDALFLFGACRELPYAFTYLQEETEIVHGPACKPEREIHLDICRRDNVPVNARRGGGGTVVLSPGMIITVIVGHRRSDEGIKDVYHRIHRPMLHLLAYHFDIHGRESGISDLSIGEKKIMGSSLYLQSNPRLFFYQSSLMVASDPTLISRYLQHPPKEPEYRRARPHEEFCTTLRREGFTENIERIQKLFSCELTHILRNDERTFEEEQRRRG